MNKPLTSLDIIEGQLAFEDNSKRAFTDFLANTVMNPYEICC